MRNACSDGVVAEIFAIVESARKTAAFIPDAMQRSQQEKALSELEALAGQVQAGNVSTHDARRRMCEPLGCLSLLTTDVAKDRSHSRKNAPHMDHWLQSKGGRSDET